MNLIVDWQGEVERIKTKAGREMDLYILYVKPSNEPYPVRMAFFDNPSIPSGRYRVPVDVGLSYDRRRLEVKLDFAKAEPLK